MNTRLTCGLLGFGAFLMASQVNAATVQINPANNRIIVNDAFTLTVQGIDFAPTNGGGFSLNWDANAVGMVMNVDEINNSLFFNGFIPVSTFLAPGRLDVSISTVVEGLTLPAKSGNFDIITLVFNTLSPPRVTTNISFIANQPAWVDENNVAFAPTLQPNYVGAIISITTPEGFVPVPAAVWLFGSGLLGLAGMARSEAA